MLGIKTSPLQSGMFIARRSRGGSRDRNFRLVYSIWNNTDTTHFVSTDSVLRLSVLMEVWIFGLERGPGISVFFVFFGPRYRLAPPVVLETLHLAQAQNGWRQR